MKRIIKKIKLMWSLRKRCRAEIKNKKLVAYRIPWFKNLINPSGKVDIYIMPEEPLKYINIDVVLTRS